MANEGKECPLCGALGQSTTCEHSTVVRNVKIGDISFCDVGWRCWQCGHEWGFEAPQP